MEREEPEAPAARVAPEVRRGTAPEVRRETAPQARSDRWRGGGHGAGGLAAAGGAQRPIADAGRASSISMMGMSETIG